VDPPQLPPPARDVVAPATGRGYPGYPESAGYTHGYADDPESGGLLEYWRILGRHKSALILLAFLGLLAGVLLTLPQTPVYQARAAMEIQDLNENFLNMKQFSPEGDSYTALTDIQTQIQLLQSESLVKRVLAKLKAPQVGQALSPAKPPLQPIFPPCSGSGSTEPRPGYPLGVGSAPTSRVAA